MLHTEEPLAHWRARTKDRADIVGYDEDAEASFLLVECKAPGVPLTHRVEDQLQRYNEVIDAPFMVATNGEETIWYQWCDDEKDYLPLNRPPRYARMRSGEKLPRHREKTLPRRPLPGETGKEARAALRDYFAIGKGSKRSHIPFLINLAGLIHLEGETPTAKGTAHGYRVRETGRRFASYGNSAGGKRPGWYTCMLLEDVRGESQVVSVSVLASMKTVEHPVFGNRPGHTMWVVAVDSFEDSHISLEYDLDRRGDPRR